MLERIIPRSNKSPLRREEGGNAREEGNYNNAPFGFPHCMLFHVVVPVVSVNNVANTAAGTNDATFWCLLTHWRHNVVNDN